MKFLILFILFLLPSISQAAFNPFPVPSPPASTLNNKGELFGHNGTNQLAIAACANGDIIEWDSGEAHGFKCGVRAGTTTVTKTTTATLAIIGEDNVVVDATTANFTVTLPAASGNSGLTYKITKSTSANIVTIDANSAETIGGELTVIMSSKDDSIIITTDGTSWFYLSDNINYSIRYTSNSGQSIGTGATIYKYEDLGHDTHSDYNTGTGLWTASLTGKYLVIATTTPNFTPSSVSNYLIIDIYVNGAAEARAVTHTGSTGNSDYGTRTSGVFNLSEGDTISIYTQSQTSSNASTIGRDNTLSISRVK